MTITQKTIKKINEQLKAKDTELAIRMIKAKFAAEEQAN